MISNRANLESAHSGQKTDRSNWMKKRGTGQSIRRILRNPLSIIGLVLILFFAILALAAPVLAPPDRWEDRYWLPRDGFSQQPQPPSHDAWRSFPPDWHLHPFGTTDGQYDIYYGVIWGARNAFRVGLVVVVVSAILGILIGAMSGYLGGWWDEVIMRLVDVLLVFPSIVLAITLIVILQHPIDLFGIEFQIDRLSAVMIAMISFGWLGFARLIRGEILSEKECDYILSARSLGASHWRIVWNHLLPNTIYPVLIVASLNVGYVVLTVAGLSFLGLGPGQGYADWGQLISFTRQWILGTPGNPFEFWFTIVPPALALTLFVMGWNLIGDAFRDIMDPKMRHNRLG